MDGQEVIIRVTALEKHASDMRDIPSKVAAVSQKVDNLETTLYREVDGLRAQQKAHKEENAENIRQTRDDLKHGFASVGEKFDAVSGKFDTIGEKVEQVASAFAQRKAYLATFQWLGSFVVGCAVIAEAVKAVVTAH